MIKTSETEQTPTHKLSIKEMRSIAQSPEILARSEENWYGKRVSRKFSIYFTKLFLILRMTPNQVTWLMLITGIVGGVLFAFPSIVLSCIAFFVFQIWIILDCSDGEVARISGKKSLFGPYLDRINHFVTDIFLLGSLGVKVYIITNDTLYLFLGALLSLINIFSRLLFRAVTSTVFEYKAYENYKVEDKVEKKSESKKGIMNLIKSLVILASKIPLRRLFTATLEISFVFVVIGIFYQFYPITNMFLILLYIYLAGNSLNVLMRFVYITLNFDEVVQQAIIERNL